MTAKRNNNNFTPEELQAVIQGIKSNNPAAANQFYEWFKPLIWHYASFKEVRYKLAEDAENILWLELLTFIKKTEFTNYVTLPGLFKKVVCYKLLDSLKSKAYYDPNTISVYDGDTFILKVDDEYHRIRLASIDAPELNQPYGQEARIALARLIENRMVIVSVIDVDKYKREVGNVYVGAYDKDASNYMLANGAAWHLSYFDRYHPKYELHAKLQLDAQTHKLGLWYQNRPTPPLVWRKKKQAP